MPNDSIFISASLLKDYLECPRKVFYRLNFPELSVQTPDMIVGIIVHSTLEKFWNDKDAADKYAKEQMEKSKLSPKYCEKAYLCISNFFNYFSFLVSYDDKIEYRFKIPFGTAFIVGKIDRITSSGYIIDWKASPMSFRVTSRDPQFILYQYVYEQIFGKPSTGALKVCLVDGKAMPYSRDKVVEYSIINNVIPAVIVSIRDNVLLPIGLFTAKCARCPYIAACHKDLGY